MHVLVYNVTYQRENKRLRSRHLFSPDRLATKSGRSEGCAAVSEASSWILELREREKTSGCEADICFLLIG